MFEQLSKLQNLTVCNDVLFIWSEAQFGTVNGLRLGTHPVQAVRVRIIVYNDACKVDCAHRSIGGN